MVRAVFVLWHIRHFHGRLLYRTGCPTSKCSHLLLHIPAGGFKTIVDLRSRFFRTYDHRRTCQNGLATGRPEGQSSTPHMRRPACSRSRANPLKCGAAGPVLEAVTVQKLLGRFALNGVIA